MTVTTAPVRARLDDFMALLEQSLLEGTFAKLVLAGNHLAGSDLKRVSVRTLWLREQPALSFVFTHATRDLTRNTDLAEGVQLARELLASTFSHAHLATRAEAIELRISRKGQQTLRRAKLAPTPAAKAAADARGEHDNGGDGDGECPGDGEGDTSFAPARSADANPPGAPSTGHDRQKRRFVDIAQPYLVDLGVTDAAHRLVPALARKWKQINKFIEIFDHAVTGAGLLDRPAGHGQVERGMAKAPIRIADFGCGKGYLTFAVHDHLTRALGVPARTTGVELRAELVALGNGAARRAGLDGLTFVEGDLRSHVPDALDVMIALHACDTATDHAIHLGVRAGARVIMCSPCCHQELRPQMASPPALAPMLRHGVHLGQQAEMVTDSLRALLLEAEGYEARVFEFVALEHTSKNKMILAVKRGSTALASEAAERARAEIERIKSFYAIREQRLENLLRSATAA